MCSYIHTRAQVDVDQCRATATKFKVEAMPTFKLIHMGKEMASIQGANEAGLRELVAKVVAACGGGAAPSDGQQEPTPPQGEAGDNTAPAPPAGAGVDHAAAADATAGLEEINA